MSRDNLFTIAPHAPFLPTLAGALLSGAIVPDWPREGPFWLSDMTIFLPTRRARLVLADALVTQMGAHPLLLPDIRALGGEEAEAEPFLPPFDAAPPPPAMPRLKRRLMLARLVERWLETRADSPFSAPGLGGYTGIPNAAEVLALADSLATLIDDFTIAGRTLGDLGGIDPAQLPERWQDALDFVRFVLGAWPEVLADAGEVDAAARTNALLSRQAQALPVLYGEKPVIVAGSTGSIPATADLIAAIARLPRGAVVMPGLDLEIDTRKMERAPAPHGHPQYGLHRLLERLRSAPGAVTELAPSTSPRTATLRAALALADDTAGWAASADAIGPAFLTAACEGMSLVEARTAEEEARAIALCVRDRLEAGQRVAVITPDQTLSRRIASELARFEIAVDDAAGTPLARTRAGRLVRQIVTLLTNGLTAVDLMALLRNRHCALGLGRARVSAGAEKLDFGALRGQRPAPGLAGLRATIYANRDRTGTHVAMRLSTEDVGAVLGILDALEVALAPLTACFESAPFTAGGFARALRETLGRVRVPETGAPAPLEGEKELDTFLDALIRHEMHGPGFDRERIALALNALMGGISVRPPRPAREDVALYGRLEARLMHADTVVLAGLNEGVWPEIADPGPWMSRGMRLAAGLEPPEKLHGLAAHDFEMAAGAPEVVMTRAERSGTSPAVPSRLVQRLEAFLGEARSATLRARGAHWLGAARRLDLHPGDAIPETRPMPRPPAAVRPRRLSVTEAETLMRSPYDLYAKYVLGLRAVPALGADPDAAERGSIVHEIFGRFISEGNDPRSPSAQATLESLAVEVFAALEAVPERRDIWLRRFAHAAAQFLAFERNRSHDIASRFAEIAGAHEFPVEGLPFHLRGRADRVDLRHDGTYEILDFKTGSVPEPGIMKGYLAPQLPLEAIMVRDGAFSSLANGETSALTYIKVANGPEAFTPRPFSLPDGSDTMAAAEAVFIRFQRHVNAFLMDDALPMTARIFPNPKQSYAGDYDHLARSEEWTLLGGEDEE